MTRASAAAVPRATTATAHTEAAKWPKALTAKPGHVCLSFKVPRKANAAALPFHLEATSRESLQVDTGPAGVSEEPCSGPLLFCSWRGMQWRSREAAERYPGAVFPQDQCPGAMWGSWPNMFIKPLILNLRAVGPWWWGQSWPLVLPDTRQASSATQQGGRAGLSTAWSVLGRST